eukprot:1194904-Prorocentrum_minimum.AAC.2
MERWLVGYKDEAPKANQGMQRRLLSEESLEQWLFNKGEKRELLSRPEETDPYKSVELAKQELKSVRKYLRSLCLRSCLVFAWSYLFARIQNRRIRGARGRFPASGGEIGTPRGAYSNSPFVFEFYI